MTDSAATVLTSLLAGLAAVGLDIQADLERAQWQHLPPGEQQALVEQLLRQRLEMTTRQRPVTPPEERPVVPSISLRPLHQQAIYTACQAWPDATVAPPKGHERYRFIIGESFVIGYQERAVVSGRNAAEMHQIARRLREELRDAATVPKDCPHLTWVECFNCEAEVCESCDIGHEDWCNEGTPDGLPRWSEDDS